MSTRIPAAAPVRAGLFALALSLAASSPGALAKKAPAPPAQNVPIPEKVPAPVDKNAAPTVTIRATDNGDVVEEYREGGKVYMVRVTPKHGKPYYLYDDDRNGRLDRTDADKASVSPVYWTIYEWD